MLRLPKRLLTAEITTTASNTQYTSPTNTRTTLAACSVTNKTGTARYVTVTLTPSGGTARNLAYQQVIPAGQTVVISGAIAQSLDAADSVEFLAESNSALDLVMSGYTTVP